MMKILFLGTLYPHEREQEFMQKSRMFDFPGNALQWSLIEGFGQLVDLQIVTAPSSLRYQGLKCAGSTFSHNDGVTTDYSVDFIDIRVLKQLISARNISKIIDNQYYDVIFIYSINANLLRPAYQYKKKHPNVKIVEIITDLPMLMSSSTSIIYRTLKRMEVIADTKYMKAVDGFILLAPEMKKKLPIENKPWIQVEGIFNPKDKVKDSISKAEGKVVLYTGNLDARYGIMDLLNAFSLTADPSYRLWICGSGDSVEAIHNCEKRDNRIRFLGSVPRCEALKLQKQATLLVNPRHSNEEYTKYSFPSKTMEYMASGTPTLMSRLKSLPDDYIPHLLFFDDENVEGMSKKLDEILSKPSDLLAKFGNQAAEFIMNSKTSIHQVKRIVDFIEKL